MDDMTAFERQVGDEIFRVVGPARPVDDLAVFEAAATQSPSWRFQTMFSATKFVVAGVIVALFGGFLLTGVLTQQSQEPLPAVGASASASPAATAAPVPSVRSDLLPGVDLVTEEVEPGVFRVLNDGVREVPWDAVDRHYAGTPSAIVVGRDGSIWNFTLPASPDDDCVTDLRGHRVGPDDTGCMVFYRLGAPETHRMADGSVLERGGVLAGSDPVIVATDGTLWAVIRPADGSGSELRSFDDATWTVRRRAPQRGWLVQVALARDQGVWASWIKRSGIDGRLGRLTDDGWAVSEPLADDVTQSLFASIDGDIYMVEGGAVRRLEGPDERVTVFEAQGLDDLDNFIPRVGGGTFWWTIEPDGGTRQFGRFDGSDITYYDNPAPGRVVAVAPDGAAWLAGQVDGEGCDGIDRFDRTEATHYLRGTCPVSVDISADGTVWVQAASLSDSFGLVHTYVITPEAAVASE